MARSIAARTSFSVGGAVRRRRACSCCGIAWQSEKRRCCVASARRFGMFGSQWATPLTASGRSIYADRGHRMSASHASKGGRRWRYYVSRAALTGRKQDAGSERLSTEALSVSRPPQRLKTELSRPVTAHLAVQASATEECHIDDGCDLSNRRQVVRQRRSRRGRPRQQRDGAGFLRRLAKGLAFGSKESMNAHARGC